MQSSGTARKSRVAVLGSPSLKILMVSVNVRQYSEKNKRKSELRGCRGGRPGFPVSSSPYGLCGRKATLKLNLGEEEEKWCTVQVSQVAGHYRKRGAVALAGQGRESPR